MGKKRIWLGVLIDLASQIAAFLLPLIKLGQKFRFLTPLCIFGIFVVIAVIDIAVMALAAASAGN